MKFYENKTLQDEAHSSGYDVALFWIANEDKVGDVRDIGKASVRWWINNCVLLYNECHYYITYEPPYPFCV